MGAKWHAVQMLYLLWALPLLVLVYVYAGQRRRQALARFAEMGLLERLRISVNPVRRRWKAALFLAGCAAIVVGLARPAWNPKSKTVQRQGRDVVFILDVSKSMLAEDLKPNRLERAKLAIDDCIDVLQGDRVGLIAFAGTAAVKCPLTLDYGFFRMMLNDISVDSIARGGTMMGDAIRKALDDVFDDRERKYKDIVLITDGEDHDSFPVQAAEQAGQRGIRIIAVGLGDENRGEPIPIVDQRGRKTYLTYQGERVLTKLDADTLRQMANASEGGKYLPVATGTIDLGTVYTNLIAAAEKRELESQTIKRYEEKFQIFLAVAFALFCLELLINERARQTGQPREAT
jgi:Ca-activated chloride channel family protein